MKNGPRSLVLTSVVIIGALLTAGCSKHSVDAPQSKSVNSPAAPPTVTEEQQPVITETVQPLVAAPSGKAPEAEPDSRRTSPSEWVELLAGNELNQWNHFPADSTDEDWTLSDGTLKCQSSKHGWLVSHEQYADFELQFDFRLVEGSNSGLHFHYSGRGALRDSSVEIQLIEDATYPSALKPTQRTGAVWGRVPPSGAALKPAGEWNHMLIHVEDNLIQVTLNDEKTVDVRLIQLRDRPSGQLAISNWRGEAEGCEFREMRIRRLGAVFADVKADSVR